MLCEKDWRVAEQTEAAIALDDLCLCILQLPTAKDKRWSGGLQHICGILRHFDSSGQASATDRAGSFQTGTQRVAGSESLVFTFC